MMSTRSNRTLPLLLAEVALIVVGLVGALALEEWRDERAERERAARVVERIVSEIQRNRAQLAERVEYHQQAAEAVQPLANRVLAGGHVGYMELLEALPNFFAPPLLSASAWDLARSSGVLAVVDLDVSDGLARLYDAQAFLQGKLDHIAGNLYEASNQDPETLEGFIVATRWLLGDIAINERRLIGIYDEVLVLVGQGQADGSIPEIPENSGPGAP